MPRHRRTQRASVVVEDPQHPENEFAAQYKGTQVTGKPLGFKFLSGSSCVLLTEGGVLHPGENKPTKERAIRASWIVMKEDGHWMLAAYHNCERDAD